MIYFENYKKDNPKHLNRAHLFPDECDIKSHDVPKLVVQCDHEGQRCCGECEQYGQFTLAFAQPNYYYTFINLCKFNIDIYDHPVFKIEPVASSPVYVRKGLDGKRSFMQKY